MIDPLFWLGLSFLLVAVSLTAVLVVAVPALQELARAARSAEKLFDTLRRDLPPTLDAIRLTGLEISDLTDEVSDGVKSAGQVVKQVDRSLEKARKQAKNVEVNTRSVFTGMKAAWKSFAHSTSPRRTRDRLPTNQKQIMELHVRTREIGEESLNSLQESPQKPLRSYYATSDTNYEANPRNAEDIAAGQKRIDDFDLGDSEQEV